MDEKLRQAIEGAGWLVWDPVTPTATGGGQCFFCIRTGPIQSLMGALREATAPIHTPASKSALMQWLKDQRTQGIRLDNMLGVLKEPHKPDERFDREIRILQTLRHPNLIRLYAHDEAKPPKWYVMEPHEVGDLQRKRDEYHQNKKPKVGDPATFTGSISEVMRHLRGVAEAVAVLHRGDGKQKIIHRDIKPGNILVAADGRWILTDLGIALETEGERLTESELQLSRDWRPDWVVGTDDYTERMDIQMLANVAYYLSPCD